MPKVVKSVASTMRVSTKASKATRAPAKEPMMWPPRERRKAMKARPQIWWQS